MNEQYRKEEEHLIKFIRSGDRKAFGVMYDKYAPLLFGVIKKSIPDHKQSEELLQQLFMTIWSKISLYDDSKQYLYNWMHALAKELILKNVSLAETFTQTPKSETTDSYVNMPGVGTVNVEGGSGKVFDLIYFKGYSYKQAAKELKIPLAVLQTNIRIELNHLRGILK